VVLRKHKHAHLGAIPIAANIFDGRFPAGCATSRCKGACCREGVWLDPAERDRILENAALVQRHMEPRQQQNPELWFEPGISEDADFPSGRAVGTEVHNGACVFLDSERRCVLQTASANQPFTLKPFFCTAFPIVIDHGRLEIDDGFDPDCCTLAPDGTRNVFEVCGAELLHVLGEEGVRELDGIAKTAGSF
jgi:hypothetical protein